jgi:hypothetical protein
VTGAAARDSKGEAQVIRRARIILLVFAGFVVTAAAVSAQEAAASFDALAGRIHVGERIWVTDATGREVRGRLERLSSDGLVLKANGLETFARPMSAAFAPAIAIRSRTARSSGSELAGPWGPRGASAPSQTTPAR